MSNVAIYTRVSTEEQGSLAAQQSALLNYCSLKSFNVVAVIEDVVSGARELSKREGGQRLLNLIKGKEVQAVVAFKLERLFRNTSDCLKTIENWQKKSVSLHLIDLGGEAIDTSSAMGKFFLTMMAGIATLDRNQISDRTKLKMNHLKQQGKRISRFPSYGKAFANGEVIDNPKEEKVITAAKELKRQGLNNYQIAKELVRLGFRSRTNNVLYAQSVKRILLAAG